MTELAISLLRFLGIVGTSTGLAWCGWIAYVRPEAGARARLLRHTAELDRRLRFVRAPFRAVHVISAQVACLVLAAAVAVELSPALAALLAPLPWLVSPVLGARVVARLDELDQQLEGWLVVLAGALSSSASLGQALGETAGMIESPLREEVSLAAREIMLGVPVSDALGRMADRVGSPTLATAVAAIRIGQRTGGGLAQTLRGTAETLREMARLEGVVRTRTAESRAQAAVVGVIPVPMVGLIHSLDPGLMRPLWVHPNGPYVIALAVLLWGSSILLARRILDVDI